MVRNRVPRQRKPSSHTSASRKRNIASPLRIIGGQFRGRKLAYTGLFQTRPMKERLREAIFNLIGPGITGMHAVDLFAGTGALGLEALSRGASGALYFEQHHPTAAVLRQNVESLLAGDLCKIVEGDVFHALATRKILPAEPWVVFSSPPYEFYTVRRGEMKSLLGRLLEWAPAESIFVIETESDDDPADFLPGIHCDCRTYGRAKIGIARVE